MTVSVPASAFIACTALVAALLPGMAEEMNMVKLHVDSFNVIGIETRTTNAQEASDGTIGKLWGRLATEDLLSRIPHRVDAHIIAVYSDYESDKDGPYTYTLGAKVSSTQDIPAGMVSKKVLSGDYAMFTAQGGAPPQMTVDLWKRIWSLEKPGPLHRAYKTDFEVHYDGLKAHPPDTHIDVYIGVQK
ncbi:MAG TPA: GyrI-like domain-containing protein [Bryobacteraceae bacterium]|nr:GyrI-like domain-containing protein [Bryobacteraceae bacterium]